MARERILIVEDEKIIALDLKRRLLDFGFEVIGIIPTGEDALTVAEKEVPDLILMDIMLKGEMDGIEAAKQIRHSLDIPVVFLTSYSDQDTLERAKQAEPFGYILKPFKERELLTTIEIVLYKHGIERKLHEQEQWMSAILKGIGDGIIAIDTENRIYFMNPIAEILTGYKEPEVKGKPIQQVFQFFDELSDSPIPSHILLESDNSFPTLLDNLLLATAHGGRIPIEGSVAHISKRNGATLGKVIAFRDVSHLRRLTDSLDYQSTHDLLTGLDNRAEILQHLHSLLSEKVIPESLKPIQNRWLLYLNLDNFRIVNNVCGHHAGDELLRQVALDIRTNVPKEFPVGRIGSDEFCILTWNQSQSEVLNLGTTLLTEVQRVFPWQKSSFPIFASIGIATLDTTVRDPYTALAMGEEACRLAKEEGGNRCRFYESGNILFQKRRGEMQWITRLTRAIDQDKFVLFTHDIVPLQQGTSPIPKKEILIRIQQEDGSLVAPSEFIPAAERYHLMPAIDRLVIRKVAEASHTLIQREAGKSPMFCINISAASIADEKLFDYITATFLAYRVSPALFCFEITETAAIQNFSRATTLIKNLREFGCTFALDDFGNGFSSFSYLKNLPVDYLKIDGSYVQNVLENPIDLALVMAVNDIGHVMGMKTIAEFVESEEIRKKLQDIGVDYGQGYLFSQPLPLLF
ncbi:MAG: EAL domain-containing protein [Spirochaetes bacterium]|nr:EAL domain-containing protein [Spirochaetota bacterium]